LAAPEAEVEAVLAHLAVVAHLEAVVAPALVLLFLAHLAHLPHLPLLQAEVVPVLVLPARAHLVLLALVRVVVVEGAVAVAELLLSRQWFSAAMARTTP